MVLNHLAKHRSIIIYGFSLAVLLLVLKWLEWRFIILDYTLELYAGSIAVFFTGLGVWLALNLNKPKTIIIEKPVTLSTSDFIPDEHNLSTLGISKRELEVLQLMADGLSNQQIGERLFVSLNTIKTHISKLFEKLDVQRRTQAVEKAKRLCLIR